MTKPLIHISKLEGKFEGFRAISSNTVTNAFCIKQNKVTLESWICSICYSHSSLNGFRKNAQPALQRNSDILSKSIIPMEYLPLLMDAFIRFNAHGELINLIHLKNLINITIKNPHCTFALWTKRKDYISLVAKEIKIPDNLILVYSNPVIDKPINTIPKHFHKVFNNVTFDKVEPETINCHTKCKDCFRCYKFSNNPNNNIIFEATKVNGRTIKNKASRVSL